MRYKTQVTQYRQNKLFRCNQKTALYEELGGERKETSDPPQADNARKFQRELWDKPVKYKEDAEWLVKVEKELEVTKIQNIVVITKEEVIRVRLYPRILSSLHQTKD